MVRAGTVGDVRRSGRESHVDEVGLREVFVTAGSYVRLLKRHWLPILLAGIVISALMGYYAYVTRPSYVAATDFLINEDPTPTPGLGAILGQVGLGGTGSEYNLEKIVALARTQKIAEAVLLDSAVVDGEDDLIVNHLVAAENLVEEWELPADVKVEGDHIAELSPESRKLLRRVYRYVFVDPAQVVRMDLDGGSGILTVSGHSANEDLALTLSERVYARLAQFYTEESVNNRRAAVVKLRNKADSIKSSLESTEYRLAQNYDTRLGISQKRPQVQRSRLEREIAISSVAYGEVIRNLEAASFSLSTSTPFFQVVGEPYLPLPVSRPSVVTNALIGAFVGAGLAFGFFAVRYFYRTVMDAPQTPQ